MCLLQLLSEGKRNNNIRLDVGNQAAVSVLLRLPSGDSLPNPAEQNLHVTSIQR